MKRPFKNFYSLLIPVIVSFHSNIRDIRVLIFIVRMILAESSSAIVPATINRQL